MDRNALNRRTMGRRIRSVRTRAAGYKLLGFPRRRLVVPACILIAKGLVPYPVKRWFMLRRSD